jgi:dTDP-4-amino-4,6-dideoxygalactose transaminase
MEIPLFKVFMSPDAPNAASETLTSGFIGQGPKVNIFEKELINHLSFPRVACVSSATAGLHLALHAVKLDDQNQERNVVLTTPLTCTATNSSITLNGLKIRWVDVDPKTCNMCLNDLRKKLCPKVKAIMVVHWAGNPIDPYKLKSIADDCFNEFGYRPPIIEDNAHGWNSMFDGKMIGTFGNTTVFSMQAIKSLTSVEGGVVLSPTDKLHERVKLLRWYGLDRESSANFRCSQNIKNEGFKANFTDVGAAIASCNLKHLNWIVDKHKENAEMLLKELLHVDGINIMHVDPRAKCSWWIFTILVENKNNFVAAMKSRGIETSPVHRRNDLHDCFKEFKSYLPGADLIDNKMTCLPCGWWCTKENIEYIIDSIKKGW